LIGGVQHGLVAQSVEPLRQAALAAVDGQAHGLRRHSLRAKAQLQSFFDQAGQARALLRGERLGLGELRVVQVERGLHGRSSNASFYRFLYSTLEPPG
jgi:uncharacterized protein (DUF3084 family)